MKTNILKSAAFIFTLVIGIFTTTIKASDNNSEFFYSNRGAVDKETTQYVSKKDNERNMVVPHMKYNFTYDNEGRLVKKEAFKWSFANKDWECQYQLQHSYINNMKITEYASWNSKIEQYNENSEKMIYQQDNNMMVAFSYKKNNKNEDWKLVSTIYHTIPNNELLAEK